MERHVPIDAQEAILPEGVIGSFERLFSTGGDLGLERFTDPRYTDQHREVLMSVYGIQPDDWPDIGTKIDAKMCQLYDPFERRTHYMSRVLEAAYKENELRDARETDQRTGLANFAGWEERLSKVIEQAKKTGDGVAVILIDVDRFKRVNDTLGHNAGDQIIVDVADIIRTHVRRTDYYWCGERGAGRLGGDEFALIVHFPNEPPQPAADYTGKERRKEDLPYGKRTDVILQRLAGEIAAQFDKYKAEHPDLDVPGLAISAGAYVWEQSMSMAELINGAEDCVKEAKAQHRLEEWGEVPFRKYVAFCVGSRLMAYAGAQDTRLY